MTGETGSDEIQFIIQNAPVYFAVTDRTGRILFINRTDELESAEVVGRSVYDFVLPEFHDTLKSSYNQLILDDRPLNLEFKTLSKGGTLLSFSCRMGVVLQNGKRSFLFIATDISEQKKTQEQLRESEERYRIVIEQTGHMVYDYNVQSGEIKWAGAVEKVTGFSLDEFQKVDIEKWGEMIHPEDRELSLALLEEARKNTGQYRQVIYRFLRKDGTYIHVEDNGIFLPDENGKSLRMLGTMEDISARILAEKTIRHQAFHDPLTDLPNRILFLDRLDFSISHAHRTSDSLAVIYMDMDRFKNINDTLGHFIGDRVLVLLSEKIKKCLREDDTVSRTGGDEFIILLNAIRPEEARNIAEKIILEISDPVTVEGYELHITTSLGIAMYPEDGTDAETLIKNADLAMYRAKETGRDTFAFYSESMSELSAERLILENDIRKGIREDEFFLLYQPILGMNGQIQAFEALARWKHPKFGVLGPNRFIPIAEDSGLILPLGNRIIEMAVETAREWVRPSPHVRISINISAQQFYQKNFVPGITKIIRNADVPCESVQLEITESIAMQSDAMTLDILRKLHQAGFLLVIDDFGTGYSSLKYLQDYPLDALKIDREFLKDMFDAPKKFSIIEAVVFLSKKLGIPVIAEGVETQKQLEALQEMNCDFVQGFYFSAPVAKEAALRMIRAGAAR